jgi:hypothetical protein
MESPQEEHPSPLSRSSTGSSFSNRSRKSTLSLDLTNIPPLTTPTLPTNTLIFTNLQNPEIFRPDNLQTIRDLITAEAPVYSWAPLKSFSRIILSFYDEESAIAIRSKWDGEAILGERVRVYFGKPTPLDLHEKDLHLALPDAGKLFFISPPPSPPHGWEMKLEDAPNKMVHAEDLAEALARLRHQAEPSPITPTDKESQVFGRKQRSRSSTLIFQPSENANGAPDLPCIAVDDFEDAPEDVDMDSPVVMETKPIMAHTARPPVELMNDL